jgi:decaprenylphospho-beta-D-ribofuranose 2-oxidase
VTDALLSGWGRTAPTRAELVRPRAVDEVVRAVAEADGRGVIARGLGRAYGDAAQNAGGRVLGMERMARVLAFDGERGTVAAEAGLSLDALMRFVLPSGWFVPVTPGTRYVTLGGALACDIHGKNHHRDGAFARHVDWFELVTPAGGVRRVDRDADADLFWATAGGMGLTGVVTSLGLRLLAVETAHMRVTTERAPDLDALLARMSERDDGFRYAVSWIDTLKRGRGMGRGILLWGDHATRDELPARAARSPLGFAPAPLLRTPDVVPTGLLSTATARAFNAVWYRRAPAATTTAYESIASFFHPLDGVRDWNRLYGARGFVQYQAVVPLDREDAVRRLLEDVSGAGASSFLAVLKRFGEGEGLISFPQRGWTLALDIPAALPELPAVLDALDAIVADAGGRVYLAKDARVRAELLERMYPRLGEWRAIQRRVDPDGTMRSDLARRLGLTGEDR